jgi:hypothetical protein
MCAMQKLRIFVVEIILTAILVGWLMWRYPELIDGFIPIICLTIAWHITWEYVLQTKPVRAWAVGIGRKIKPMISWPLVFCVGGLISLGYWRGINVSLQRLARAAAQLKKEQSKEQKPESVTSPPAPQAQPDHETRAEPAPPLKREGTHSPKPGPRMGTGPEAYKDLSDEQVGDWIIEEAKKIESMAETTINKPADSSGSRDANNFFFGNDFKRCCAQDVKDLRTEALLRLGPPGKDAEEQRYWEYLFRETMHTSGAPELVNPFDVKSYSLFFKQLGIKLKRRSVPRAAPRLLEFSEQAVRPQHAGFPFEIIITIKTDKIISSGYVLVEFTSGMAGAATDFHDSGYIIGNESFLSDNKRLSDYLSQLKTGRVYPLAIGKTPLSPDNPVHVEAYALTEIHVSKVLLFDE